MKKGKILLSQPAFQVFLFCLFFVLFNWPFSSLSVKGGLAGIVNYLLLNWAVLIVLLFLVNRSLHSDTPDKNV